jgi:thiamine biosynthesis lipoprotein
MIKDTMKTRRAIGLLLIALILPGCGERPGEAEIAGEAQGTTYHIKLVLDGAPTPLKEIRNRVSAMLAEIDAQMSNYRDDSEISRLNRQENTDWLPVSPEIIELLAIARTVYERSNGCYDLTVKSLFDLWGFSRHQNRVPTQAEIDALLPHVGMPLLEIDTENRRIRKQDPKLKIDLASIAQGYSVGKVARRLEELGIRSYMVEIGGEMMVKGRKADGSDWRIGLEAPTPFVHQVRKVLGIREQSGTAVMTAGTYRNFFEENGQSYSHILNPKTGKPVNHRLRSVTVLHEDPSWADAWDTALLCAGEREAARIADAENLKVLFIYDDNGLKEHMSKAFAAAQ